MARLNSETQAGLDYKTVRDYYDRVYYKEASVERTALNHYCRLARRFVPWQEKRLLDVACGTGTWLQAATALGAYPTGVDISPVRLKLAGALCRKRHFTAGLQNSCHLMTGSLISFRVWERSSIFWILKQRFAR